MRNPLPRRTRAVALLLVLGGLVLISVVVLAFLHSTATELKSSKVYADGGNVRQLSDTAVNVVIGQIRDATKSRDGSGNRLAWASQPGMIRTYDDSGNAAGYYKLYSSSGMTGSGAFNPTASTETIPASWNTDTGFYVDLNEPLSGRYPIVDPGAIGKVEGFALDSSAAAVSGKTNPLPMPAQWLYVLADGTIVAPTGAGSKAIVPGATPANPIVSRIAFWTDDETAKVNINTASEGTFWDTPKALSTFDVGLGNSQPVLNEFQRYPGHPATTSLSPILGWKYSMTGSNGLYNYSQLQPYYSLAPRVNEGGSKAGTVALGSAAKIVPDTDRLYATVDELEFLPDRTPLANSSTPLTADDIDKMRFFLTARSRAPDVNLFNRPRVVAWPISSQSDAMHRTIWDRAIAFCGTIGGKAFYFQRNDPNSSTNDLSLGNNSNLRGYLKNLTAANIPGFGGNYVSKYSTDRDQILTECFDYIRSVNLVDLNGGAAFSPYTPNSTATGSGKGQVIPIHDGDTRGFGRFPTLSEAAFLFVGAQDHTTDPTTVPSDKSRIQATILPECFDPSSGFPVMIGNFQIRVSGLNNLKWGVTSADTPMFSTIGDTTTITVKVTNPTLNLTRKHGGFLGFRRFLSGNTTNKLFSDLSPLLDDAFAKPGATFIFSGGQVTFEFLSITTGETVQKVTLNFQGSTLPVPKVIPPVTPAFTGGPTTPPGFLLANKYNFHHLSTDADSDGHFGRFAAAGGGQQSCWVTEFDVVRSVFAQDGDYRLVAAQFDSAGPLFTSLPNYTSAATTMSHTLIEATGTPFYGSTRGWLVKDALYLRSNIYPNPTDINTYGNVGLTALVGNQDVFYNGVALGKHGAFANGDIPGDWDNGFGDVFDGPYINKPDEGVVKGSVISAYFYPDNESNPAVDAGGTFFSPNRQIPSAVMFGSLPSGVKANRPWQTLLFRADPSGKHPGNRNRKVDGSALAGAPPDHLLLDLFQMPIVEPYPISEPLSTAGRINMNYQIVPFTYLTRDTGIRAVLKSERLLAIPNQGTVAKQSSNTSAVDYKRNVADNPDGTVIVTTNDWRKDIDLTETLKGFAAKFATGDIFRSASEICELPLVPAGSTYTAVSNPSTDFWYTNFPLTGDNSREKPYADIYPRLTTKSNTYAVHYRVQTLQRTKARQTTSPTEFDTAAGDTVAGEFRGTTVIERYVDPNDSTLPNFSTASLGDASSDLDGHYRFRTISSKQFTP